MLEAGIMPVNSSAMHVTSNIDEYIVTSRLCKRVKNIQDSTMWNRNENDITVLRLPT
jgi:hypothetical protein